MTDTKKIKLMDESTQMIIETVQEEKVPIDKGNIAFIIHIFFGVGCVMAWSAILTSFDFFAKKMPDYRPDFVFSISLYLFTFASSIWNILYGDKYSFRVRLMGSYIVNAVAMVLLPLATYFLEPSAAFAVDMCILAIFGICNGISQACAFGIGGMLPIKYIGAVFVGYGSSDISMNVIRAICLVVFPPQDNDLTNDFYGALAYFSVSMVVLLLCAFLYLIFEKNEFGQYYIKKATDEKMRVHLRLSQVKQDEVSKSLVKNSDGDDEGHERREIKPSFMQSPKAISFLAFLQMLKNSFMVSRKFLSVIAYNMLVTFIVFPGMLCDTKLTFLDGLDDSSRTSWIYLLFVIFYNISDLTGKWFGGRPWAFVNDNLLVILILCRSVFIATAFLIVYDVSPSWLFGDNGDWFKIINMLLFGFSNGYLSTQAAAKAPSIAPDESKEQVGNFLGIFFLIGIFVGSLIAFGIGQAIPNNLIH